MDRFNESRSARTVAGLMRTLGTPRVSVGAAAGSPSEVRITVAWELSWYQWGVDVGDESRPVFELGKRRRADRARRLGPGLERRRRGGRPALPRQRRAGAAQPRRAPAAGADVKVVVNVDGGSRGNPGPAAIAAVVQEPGGGVLEEAAERIGTATNNVAEYRALLLGHREGGGDRRHRARAGRRLGADRAPGRRASTRSRTRRCASCTPR